MVESGLNVLAIYMQRYHSGALTVSLGQVGQQCTNRGGAVIVSALGMGKKKENRRERI